jgi:hypothetical protein
MAGLAKFSPFSTIHSNCVGGIEVVGDDLPFVSPGIVVEAQDWLYRGILVIALVLSWDVQRPSNVSAGPG